MNTNVNRRSFLAGASALVGSSAAFGAPAAARAEADGVMLDRLGFDPNREGDFVFFHATDLHSSETERGALRIPNKFEGRSFVDDINACAPTSAFVLLTGDLISETTLNPSTWERTERYWKRYRRVITDRLRIPFWQIIGNNDCAPEPYRRVYPELPLTWTFERGGVCFVGIHGYGCWKVENTNHAGILLDAQQLAELEKTISGTSARTLALVTHEPLWVPDSHRACRQLAPILRKFRGEEIWNIAGHEHANELATFRLGDRIVQGVQTITPVGSWTPDKGAYRVLAVSGGRITASALRWMTKDGEPVSFVLEKDIRPTKVTRLFGERLTAGARKTFFVGEEDLPLRGAFTAVEDRLSNLRFYKKGASAIYRVPLEGVGAHVLRLAVKIPSAEALAVSADGKTWQTPEIKVENGFTHVVLPKDWREIHFRIGQLPYGNGLYGFALV